MSTAINHDMREQIQKCAGPGLDKLIETLEWAQDTQLHALYQLLYERRKLAKIINSNAPTTDTIESAYSMFQSYNDHINQLLDTTKFPI